MSEHNITFILNTFKNVYNTSLRRDYRAKSVIFRGYGFSFEYHFYKPCICLYYKYQEYIIEYGTNVDSRTISNIVKHIDELKHIHRAEQINKI